MVPDIAAGSGQRSGLFSDRDHSSGSNLQSAAVYITASGNSLCDKFLRTIRTKELMEVIQTLRKDTSREDQFR
jgi:hypothetical protein